MKLIVENVKYDAATIKYLKLLSKEYPSISQASNQIINLQAVQKLPKGTEHFMSDLHGEHEAFLHILNNASGVVREKVDIILGEDVPEEERAELATLIYYPLRKLPRIKEKQSDLHGWYRTTLTRLIDISRLVSSKHTRQYVRNCLPPNCAYILDELLHAHFEDHNKELYYGQIIESIIEADRADKYIFRFCELIKRLCVDHLHIVGDLFDRGPRPDIIVERLMEHHSVDIQWGNHDVVWMGAAAGSPLCIATMLKTTLSYYNLSTLEEGYGISIRALEHLAEESYQGVDLKPYMPKIDKRQRPSQASILRCARMHMAITMIMLKLECQVMDRNPDFAMEGRDFLRRIDYENFTVECQGKSYPLKYCDFPTVDPEDPAKLTKREQEVMNNLIHGFTRSEKLRAHTEFLYAMGGTYFCKNNNLLYHGAIPLTEDGKLAEEIFDGVAYKGKALMDYCDVRARQGFYAPEGSVERQAGQDFLWYLWCGRKSPLFGKSAMTTFERIYIADKSTHTEVKDPYYSHYNKEETVEMILREFGIDPQEGHIINGHVPVRAVEGESPLKGGNRLIVIDGGFCRAYHDKTGIAGYTLVYSSRGMSLRVHQPFESAEKAIENNEDIVSRVDVVETRSRRILVEDTDEGRSKKETIQDLKKLVAAYKSGLIKEESK